jgi:hypothetical protein
MSKKNAIEDTFASCIVRNANSEVYNRICPNVIRFFPLQILPEQTYCAHSKLLGVLLRRDEANVSCIISDGYDESGGSKLS